MNPSFGPVAGGTKVMLKFDVNLPGGPYLINFSNNANGSRYNVSANISGCCTLLFLQSISYLVNKYSQQYCIC